MKVYEVFEYDIDDTKFAEARKHAKDQVAFNVYGTYHISWRQANEIKKNFDLDELAVRYVLCNNWVLAIDSYLNRNKYDNYCVFESFGDKYEHL